MEEESWASCGNRDYLTPWELSFLSTKSSPMLSMMLGVEGEDEPSCNSWSPSLMCMNIIFNVSSPLLPQFPSTSSCTKSWSQSLLHIVVASFNSSLSHCCLIFMNFSFNFKNRTCTETLFYCEVHEFYFPTSPHSPKIDSEQESYAHFIPTLQSVPTNFRTHNVQCSCHISLYSHWSWMRWNGNFMELLNINFFFLVRLCPCAKFDENSGACSQTLEMLTNLISSLITNSWEHFVMLAKQFKCTIYPQGDSWE